MPVFGAPKSDRLAATRGQDECHHIGQTTDYRASPLHPPSGRKKARLSFTAAALTAREVEVLALLAEGASNKVIARALGISVHTAKLHVRSLIDKLDAVGRTDVVTHAARLGVLRPLLRSSEGAMFGIAPCRFMFGEVAVGRLLERRDGQLRGLRGAPRLHRIDAASILLADSVRTLSSFRKANICSGSEAKVPPLAVHLSPQNPRPSTGWLCKQH